MWTITRCDILKTKTVLVKSVYRVLERTFWSLVCFCELVQLCALLCKLSFMNVERTQRGSVSNICWNVSHDKSWNSVLLQPYWLLYLSAVFPWRNTQTLETELLRTPEDLIVSDMSGAQPLPHKVLASFWTQSKISILQCALNYSVQLCAQCWKWEIHIRKTLRVVYVISITCPCFFFPVTLRPNPGHGLVLEVSRSHVTTHHSQ
jgi:hypothetical protein